MWPEKSKVKVAGKKKLKQRKHRGPRGWMKGYGVRPPDVPAPVAAPVLVGLARRIMTPRVSPESSTVIYHLLKYAGSPDGKCRQCDQATNLTTLVLTDLGMRSVVKCAKCGLVMVPFPF